jgi:hypothetical protein
MARLFNGTSDYLTGTLDLSSTAIVTVTCRLYWDAYATDGDRAMEYTNNPDAGFNGFMIAPNESGSLFGCGISGPGGSTYWTDTFTRPSAAAWHLYTFVFNRTTPVNKAWVDGVSQTLTTQTHNGAAGGNNFDGTSTEINVMRRGTGILFGAGRMAEIAIWNHELSAGDLTALHSGARPSTVDRANLLFYCPVTGAASPEPSVVGNSLTVNGAVFTAHPIDFVEPGRSYKRFVGPAALSATPETLYTVPYNGRSVIRNIYANNPSGADAALTLSIGPSENALLDDFNRADDASSLGGNWNAGVLSGYTSLGIQTNRAYLSAGYKSNYWATQFGADQQAYVKIPVLPTTDIVALVARLQNPGTASRNYYMVQIADFGSGLEVYLYKVVAGTPTFLTGIAGAGDFSAGDGIGISCVGSTITGWWYHDGVWDMGVGAPVTDASVSGPGYVGMYVDDDTTVRLDDFTGGEFGTLIFDEDTVPAGDILFARRDTNYVLEAGEVLQGFSDTAATVVLVVDGVEYGL